MGDDADEKAKKLAAARKKLKEFQSRQHVIEHNNSKAQDVTTKQAETATPTVSTASDSVTSDLSDRSSSDANLSENLNEIKSTEDVQANKIDSRADIIPNTEPMAPAIPATEPLYTTTNDVTTVVPDVVNYFATAENTTPFLPQAPLFEELPPQHNINTLQVLINEKAQLSTELNKLRTSCREKDLELEEMHTQYDLLNKRNENLQQRFVEKQQGVEDLRRFNAELQHKLAQSKAASEDQATHLEELQRQLSQVQAKVSDLEEQYKTKCNELEMAQLRIQQLNDESSFGKDNRVEALTQTQFMYEQQIRDLQAMVQQLTQDKEQANVQYQNYVQHLNTEISKLQAKYAEQTDENTKLQEREKELVEHVSSLEREIQKKIQHTEQAQEENTTKQDAIAAAAAVDLQAEIEKLQEKISDFDLERHEFQLKIKSQDDNLAKLTLELQQKQIDMEELQTRVEHLTADKPDTNKLLATMESDKIAASRAVAQNMELKKQLDELELRFVQLTNDKAELMNQLDAESYANREIRQNYAQMEEKLRTSDERFKFKDEEMIRLSHENMELQRNNLVLQQQIDRLKHYEVERYHENYQQSSEDVDAAADTHKHDHNHMHRDHEHEHTHRDHSHEHEHAHHEHDHEHTHHANDHAHDHFTDKHDDDEHHHHDGHDDDNHHEHQHEHVHEHGNNDTGKPANVCEVASEAGELTPLKYPRKYANQLPTADAVEKLQQRFTYLISQVADLTDEKQHLEHLVLQLQSETETIGEYIALYQTQRRILKQREYEKAAQTQLLQAERQQLREKIAILNNLVSSLGLDMPQHNTTLQQHLNAALTESVSIEPEQQESAISAPSPATTNTTNNNVKSNSTDSQQILAKIQDIIQDIQENTKDIPIVNTAQQVDHLNCCLGKFEVV